MKVMIRFIQNRLKKQWIAKDVGKQITYKFGYTNLTFDLWIILHKANCNGTVTHRKNYIAPLNRVYNEQFADMKEFKHKDNFKRCLGQLNLSNAISRANRIMQRNKENIGDIIEVLPKESGEGNGKQEASNQE